MLFRRNSPPIGKPDAYVLPNRIGSWEEFEQLHAHEYERMAWYWTRWWNSHKPTRVGWEELDPEQARYMYAVNMQSRMDFVQVVHRHMGEFLERNRNTHGHWITLAPRQFTMLLEDAAEFDVNRLHHWVYQALRGLHYVGMVEAGYFERILPWPTVKYLSWHVHLIARLHPQTMEILSDLEQRDQPAFQGMTTTHFDTFKRETLLKRVYYMMKTPWKRYRLRHSPFEVIDWSTGVVREIRTKKDNLRSGQISRLYDVMGQRLLDKLIFGGGDGVAAVNLIRDEALARLPAWERNGERPPS